jgi:hypothetical protein
MWSKKWGFEGPQKCGQEAEVSKVKEMVMGGYIDDVLQEYYPSLVL